MNDRETILSLIERYKTAGHPHRRGRRLLPHLGGGAPHHPHFHRAEIFRDGEHLP